MSLKRKIKTRIIPACGRQASPTACRHSFSGGARGGTWINLGSYFRTVEGDIFGFTVKKVNYLIIKYLSRISLKKCKPL